MFHWLLVDISNAVIIPMSQVKQNLSLILARHEIRLALTLVLARVELWRGHIRKRASCRIPNLRDPPALLGYTQEASMSS